MVQYHVTSTTVPIPKGCNVDLTVSDNYRSITLSSIFGKVFDLIVLSSYSDKLASKLDILQLCVR